MGVATPLTTRLIQCYHGARVVHIAGSVTPGFSSLREESSRYIPTDSVMFGLE